MAKSSEYQAGYTKRKKNASMFGISMNTLRLPSRRDSVTYERMATSSGFRPVKVVSRGRRR